MIHLFDDNFYFLTMIILILMIVIFGGPKKHDNLQIEYQPNNFGYLNNLTYFENQIHQNNISSDIEFTNITEKINLSNCLVPNIVDIFIVNIKPYQIFNVGNHVKNDLASIMIIYDHNMSSQQYNFSNIPNLAINNLKLLINKKKECVNYNCNLVGYYYDISKKVSILDIFPIYNDSEHIVNITIFIIKKPYWFY